MALDINTELKDILNERSNIREKVRQVVSNQQLLEDNATTSGLVAEIKYFNDRLYDKVSEHEKLNTTILSKIDKLNKSNKERQLKHKELKQTYQKHKNLGSGMEIASKDSSQMYRSVLISILLKNTALIGLYYYLLSN